MTFCFRSGIVLVIMDWKEVEERLIQQIGVNYFNYPKCVEWNIKVMKYLEKNRKVKALEKIKS